MDEGSVCTPSREDEWSRHPVRANIVRFSLAIIPLIAAIGTTYFLVDRFGQSRLGLPWLGWIATLVIVSASVSAAAGRLVQRWLPLTRLLELNLLFPDVAPSRYRQALRSGRSRELQRRLAAGQSLGDFAMGKADYLLSLLVALTQHDRLTRGHSERVRAYADMIAEEMGLSRRDRQLLHWAALLHDVGKLDVPNRILSKPGRPDDHEWELLKEHPQASVKYLEPIADWLGDWGSAAQEHHLRWDGKGYPATTAGTDISLAGRIVAVADAYDVMTSARSYKKPLSAAHACTELTRGAGTQFDPAVVRAFLNVGLGRIRAATGPLSALAGLSGSSSRVVNFLATQASQLAQVTTTVAIAAVGAVALTLSAAPGGEPVVEAAGAVNEPTPSPSPVAKSIETPVLVPAAQTPAPTPTRHVSSAAASRTAAPTTPAARTAAPSTPAARTAASSTPAARTAAPTTPAARTAAPATSRQPPSAASRTSRLLPSTLPQLSAAPPAPAVSHIDQPTPIITLATPTADVVGPLTPIIELRAPAQRATSTPAPGNYPVVARPPTTPIVINTTSTPTITRPTATSGPERPLAASTPTGQPFPAPTQAPQIPPAAVLTPAATQSPIPTLTGIPAPAPAEPTKTAIAAPTAAIPTPTSLPPTIALPPEPAIPIASPTPTTGPYSTPTTQPTVPTTPTSVPTAPATTTPVPTGQATTTPAPTSQATTTPVPTSQATTTPVPSGQATTTPVPTASATSTPTPVVTPSGSYVAIPTLGSGTVTNPDGSTVTYIETYRVGRDGDLIGHPRRWASYTFSTATSIRLAESITPRWSAGDTVSVVVSGPDSVRAPTVRASGVGHLGYQLQGGELIITYVVDGAATIEFDEVVTFGISVLASDADGAGVNVRYFVATPA